MSKQLPPFPKPQKPQQPPQPKPRRGFDDFSEEYVDKPCLVYLASGQTIKGRVIGVQRYWIKVFTNNNQVLYLNKAHVIGVEVVL